MQARLPAAGAALGRRTAGPAGGAGSRQEEPSVGTDALSPEHGQELTHFFPPAGGLSSAAPTCRFRPPPSPALPRADLEPKKWPRSGQDGFWARVRRNRKTPWMHQVWRMRASRPAKVSSTREMGAGGEKNIWAMDLWSVSNSGSREWGGDNRKVAGTARSYRAQAERK